METGIRCGGELPTPTPGSYTCRECRFFFFSFSLFPVNPSICRSLHWLALPSLPMGLFPDWRRVQVLLWTFVERTPDHLR